MMASARSSTGDIKNNLMKLLREVQRMRLQIEPNVHGMSLGVPSAFLPLLHASLMHYSLPLANWLTKHDYELYGKNDLRFLEGLYKVLRDVFHYHPQLTREQFLSTGFAERKILLTTDVLCFCQRKHCELVGRRPARRERRRMVSTSSKPKRSQVEVLTVQETSAISSAWSEAAPVNVQALDSTLDVGHPQHLLFTPPHSPEHPHPTYPPSSMCASTLGPIVSPAKDLELTPVPAHLRATSSPARSRATVDSRRLGTSGTSKLSSHVQPILHSTRIPAPDLDVGSVVKHFPIVEDQSDQRTLHVSHLHGYKPVLPHVQFPATFSPFSKSTREMVSKTRDMEGFGPLEGREKEAGGGDGERGEKRRGGEGEGWKGREEDTGGREEREGMAGRGERGEGGEKREGGREGRRAEERGGSRDSSPESWHSLPLQEEGVEEEGPCFQQGREAAGHMKTEGDGIQDGRIQPSLQDISNHMEQLTHLVERMSARFVILETQLKLVKTHQPGEQRLPPMSLPSFDTQEAHSPPHDNRTTKKVTMVEVAPSPPVHHQISSHSLSPSQLVHIQTGTGTPAKMRTLLKSPPSSPPPITSGTLSANCKSVSTPLNTWTVHNPSGDTVNLSFHSAADDQLHRKIQSPICSKSPAKLSSVHQTSGFCFTPTTPDDTKRMIENLRNRARRTKEFLQKANTQHLRT